MKLICAFFAFMNLAYYFEQGNPANLLIGVFCIMACAIGR